MTIPTYAIVGLHDGLDDAGPGSIPMRFEISSFVDPKRNKYAHDQLNLFLQAVERMQKAPTEELVSWFQVGGIHGQPYVAWDGAESQNHSPGDQAFAYCQHGSVLFPTWHRVYVLLMEQAVHKYMLDVLSEFPLDKQAELKPATDHWRMPYWDWARRDETTKTLILPDLLKQPTVSVLRPNGQTVQIDNPLYRYAFPMKDGKIDGINDSYALGYNIPFSTSPFTIRQPPAYDDTKPMSVQAWAEGISDNSQVDAVLNNALQSNASMIYNLFAGMRSYPSFATATKWGRGDNSLEGVHNNVHRHIGGSWGHMTVFDVAGFDPIFWMHHGNIEHFLCIFQALNPVNYDLWPDDTWLQATQQPWFEGKADHAKEAKVPLEPFHKDAHGQLWTSNACRDITPLGYSYEDLQPWKYQGPRLPPRPIMTPPPPPFDAPKYCSDIRKAIKERYEWAVPQKDQVARVKAKVLRNHPAEANTIALIGLGEKTFSEYVVNVLVDRFAFEGQTFSVHIFLGSVPEEVSDWHAAATSVGSVVHFGGGQFQRGVCANCERLAENEETRTIGGRVSLTKTLLDIIEADVEMGGKRLRSLGNEDVSEFLRENLHWRVSTLGDIERDAKDVRSLRVSVAVASAKLPSADDELISYGDFDELDGPTKDRVGGI